MFRERLVATHTSLVKERKHVDIHSFGIHSYPRTCLIKSYPKDQHVGPTDFSNNVNCILIHLVTSMSGTSLFRTSPHSTDACGILTH